MKYSDGVSMKWDDAMVVYLTIDKSYSEKTSGICGNFNQETSKTKFKEKIINLKIKLDK